MLNKLKVNILEQKINNLNRVKLANLPTPLIELPNFTKFLGGPKIYIKRDDLTGGVAFGGNKTRMLEFRLAPAVDKKADIIVYGAAIQSNHARQIAVAARKLGMDISLILRKTSQDKGDRTDIQGNFLIDLLADAQIKIVESTQKEQMKLIHEEVKMLEKKGRNPFETGIHDIDLSAIAYVSCSLEISEQIIQRNIKPTHLYVASEGATQAGLSLFSKYVQADYSVVGINIVDWVPNLQKKISSIANKAAVRLGIECNIQPEDIENHSNYVGPGYAIPTPECLEAIKLLAKTEGIVADPVYSGKGLSGLIDHIRKGKLTKEDTVIYLHTGGAPALFCYANYFKFNNI